MRPSAVLIAASLHDFWQHGPEFRCSQTRSRLLICPDVRDHNQKPSHS